jgi:hypothetical protein
MVVQRPSVRFSLRTLLVLVALCGLGLWQWDVHVESYRRQRQVAMQVQGVGGVVHALPVDAPWRRALFPEEHFVKVVFVGLSMTAIDDSWLARLRQLPDLQKLFLDGTPIGDLGLVYLAGHDNLQMLGLTGTRITDRGLRRLRPLFNLENLWLDNTAITDAGLAELGHLRSLRLLALRGCSISDAGLAHLQAFPELQVLDLRNTPVTDAGMARVARLTKLQTVLLDDTEVTEASLVHFQKLPALAELSLAGTQIIPNAASPLFDDQFTVSKPRLTLKPGEKITREFSHGLHQPVAAVFNDRPLRDVFNYISRQHAIGIRLDPTLRLDTLVTIDFRGQPAGLALERLFEDHNLHGVIADNLVCVYAGQP